MSVAHAAPPSPQEPVPVIVQNTPLPVEITNTPVAIIPAERAGLVVQGTVAAGQSGSWTVDLAPGATVHAPARRTFIAAIAMGGNSVGERFTNETNELLVIDRVSAFFESSVFGYWLFGLVHWTGETEESDRVVFALSPPAGGSQTPRWVLNAMTQIYVKPNQYVRFCCSDGSLDKVFMSGHYEPMAQP
jgi:hypothetical protein